ncbi:hypothetical protein CDIK_1502 [Cucumispora dikerogammari]|nr:hypothetical protein CDIK_1502 [Cucumispora dikerogammari]
MKTKRKTITFRVNNRNNKKQFSIDSNLSLNNKNSRKKTKTDNQNTNYQNINNQNTDKMAISLDVKTVPITNKEHKTKDSHIDSISNTNIQLKKKNTNIQLKKINKIKDLIIKHREKESKVILSFLFNNTNLHNNQTKLNISGPPGTGKTHTIISLLKYYKIPYKLINLSNHNILKSYTINNNIKVLVVDEYDIIYNSKYNKKYNITEIINKFLGYNQTKNVCNYKVITITNNIHQNSKGFNNTNISKISNNIHFKPYTPSQLYEILVYLETPLNTDILKYLSRLCCDFREIKRLVNVVICGGSSFNKEKIMSGDVVESELDTKYNENSRILNTIKEPRQILTPVKSLSCITDSDAKYMQGISKPTYLKSNTNKKSEKPNILEPSYKITLNDAVKSNTNKKSEKPNILESSYKITLNDAVKSINKYRNTNTQSFGLHNTDPSMFLYDNTIDGVSLTVIDSDHHNKSCENVIKINKNKNFHHKIINDLIKNNNNSDTLYNLYQMYLTECMKYKICGISREDFMTLFETLV